jgi:hypothetical protein
MGAKRAEGESWRGARGGISWFVEVFLQLGCDGLDFLAIDLTDPTIGFPVVQVVVPSYSDVLPYHAPSSPALFRAITRSEVLASYPNLPCGNHQV